MNCINDPTEFIVSILKVSMFNSIRSNWNVKWKVKGIVQKISCLDPYVNVTNFDDNSWEIFYRVGR